MSDDETRRLLTEWQSDRERKDAELAERLDRLEQRDAPPLTHASAAATMRRGYAQSERERAAAADGGDE